MNNAQIQELFDDFIRRYVRDDDYDKLKSNGLLLAHYTSVGALESIIRTNEIWLSNPLFMNDLEEMRFGLELAKKLFFESKNVKNTLKTKKLLNTTNHILTQYYNQFYDQHYLDVYVFCFSEHDPDHEDGVLSMWRGYGGQGSGVAIIVDTGFLRDDSPILIAKVDYLSTESREKQIESCIADWCETISHFSLSEEIIPKLVQTLFYIFLLSALTTKHNGFSEEKEWRLIYLPIWDSDEGVKNYFDYVIGDRGVEPKLKLLIGGENYSDKTWNLSTITKKIILGPTISSPIAKKSVVRMLEKLGVGELKDKVSTSGIPLRPR